MEVGAACATGLSVILPSAQISYDQFHVVSMIIEAMAQVRRSESAQDMPWVRRVLGGAAPMTLRQLMWGIRRNALG